MITEQLAERPVAIPTHRWPRMRWSLLLPVLTFATLLVHGYHPLAEDGGLYVAGVELTLNRALFPQWREFVSEHLRFSIFAPVMALLTKLTHLPLSWVLLAAEIASIALMLLAARELLRRITSNPRAQWAGVALLAALWTVPVAGTSLLLMDPYVTARSFSTPLSLWAVALALDDWRAHAGRRAWCFILVALAAALHPLMAGYGLGFVIVVRSLRSPRKGLILSVLALLTFVTAGLLQAHAGSDAGPVILASESRYYWFLSQWHWYEIFGLVGPLLVLRGLRKMNSSRLGSHGLLLIDAAMLYGCFATALTAVFAQEHFQAHVVARMQPLRVFLLIYTVMFLLLGASLEDTFEDLASRMWPVLRFAIVPMIATGAVAMFFAQRSEFPDSAHVELPFSLTGSPNPWVRAFAWCRDNTPPNALFALDAHYITTQGEDAQTFRAIAERSALPDFSKDGGEAAITPGLAKEWAQAYTAQLGLDRLSAQQLRARLAGYSVDYVILRSGSPAALPCPYNNGTIRVCRLGVRAQRN